MIRIVQDESSLKRAERGLTQQILGMLKSPVLHTWPE